MKEPGKSEGIPVSQLRPRAADAAALLRLQNLEEEWPKELFRFALFERARDGESVRYRSVAWSAEDRQLHVLKLVAEGTPQGPGNWEIWSVDGPDSPLKDIRRAGGSGVPDFMGTAHLTLPEKLRKKLVGFGRRKRVVQAFCFLDTYGQGREADYVFNDRVVMESSARLEAQHYVSSTLGRERGWESYIRKLFHQFCHFAGEPNAMLALHDEKGGKKGKGTRTGKHTKKPGRRSDAERRAKLQSEATGKKLTYHRRPVNLDDEKKFLDALIEYWAHKRLSLSRTYAKLVLEHYAEFDERNVPTIDTFRYHARHLIKDHDLLARRNGATIHEQDHLAHVGQATEYTQGVIEIVDIDAFTAKIAIAVKVRKKIQRTYVKVVIAISRNSHAVLATEVVLKGENAVAYRRCIASIYLDKKARAAELGLESAVGLVSGTIDGVFVDNGAGPSKENVDVACVEMRLGMEMAPPGRGDYKGVVEGFNSLLVELMQEESSGHNRRKDKVQQDERRRKRRNRAVRMSEFERLLYRAQQHHNLTANRDHLRDGKKLGDGEDGNPRKLFEDTQKKRRADGARRLAHREVFSRFVPWKKYTCREGLIHFKKKLRYWSEELKKLWNEHVKTPKPYRRVLTIQVKRLDGTTQIIVWKKPNGEEGLLRLVPEDARRMGILSWSEAEMTFESDSMRKPANDAKQRESRDRVTVEQNSEIAAAEKVLMTNGKDLEGMSIADAKERGTAQRDREWGAKHAAAAGIVNEEITLPNTHTPSKISAVDQAYVARLKAKQMARSGGHSSSPRA
jgi:hypothetical protein